MLLSVLCPSWSTAAHLPVPVCLGITCLCVPLLPGDYVCFHRAEGHVQGQPEREADDLMEQGELHLLLVLCGLMWLSCVAAER